MKKFVFIALIPALLLGFSSCGDDAKEVEIEKIEFKTTMEKVSYAMGAENAANLLKESRFDALDKAMVIEGYTGNLTMTPPNECDATLEKFLGERGMDFDTTYLKDGSKCIGRYLGFQMFSQMTQIGKIDDIDLEMVKKGFEQGMYGQDTVNMTLVERTKVMTDFGNQLQEEFFAEIDEKDQIFWEDVLSKPGVEQIGETGVYIETIKRGTGGSPEPTSDFEANYILTNALGDTLESSYDAGAPLKMNLQNVIQGWQIGFPAMKKGGKYRIFIPYEKAYKNGNPQAPQGALCFFVELINFGPAGSIATPRSPY